MELTSTITSFPTPVSFRLVALRAVKDKLPRGRYVVAVTVFNRLGGVPHTWSRLPHGGAGPGMPGASAAFKHRGRYYDVDVLFDSATIYALAPARADASPSFVYIFEVLQLKNSRCVCACVRACRVHPEPASCASGFLASRDMGARATRT